MLSTLSLFALEPTYWIKQYEWRECTDLEFVAKNIFSAGLVSQGSSWVAGLDWLDELCEWSLQYEIEHMVPAILDILILYRYEELPYYRRK